jgi:hypothetical protein
MLKNNNVDNTPPSGRATAYRQLAHKGRPEQPRHAIADDPGHPGRSDIGALSHDRLRPGDRSWPGLPTVGHRRSWRSRNRGTVSSLVTPCVSVTPNPCSRVHVDRGAADTVVSSTRGRLMPYSGARSQPRARLPRQTYLLRWTATAAPAHGRPHVVKLIRLLLLLPLRGRAEHPLGEPVQGRLRLRVPVEQLGDQHGLVRERPAPRPPRRAARGPAGSRTAPGSTAAGCRPAAAPAARGASARRSGCVRTRPPPRGSAAAGRGARSPAG